MRKMLRVFSIAILLPLISGVVWAAEEEGQKWGKVTEEQWNQAPPTDYPEAAAVVLFDVGSLEVPPPYEGQYIEFKRHVRIKIFNKAAASEAATIEIPESDLRGFKAQTILKNGKKIEVSGKDRFEKTVGNSKVTTFTFPALEDGCVVEYKYGLVQDTYSLLDPWYFQNDLYTLESQFTLILWGGFTYNTLLVNVPQELRTPTRKELTIDKMGPVEFTWTLHNLEPVEDEPYSAATSNYRAALICQLSSYQDLANVVKFADDWKTLGDKVLVYYGDFVRSRGELEKVTQSLVADQPSDLEKARKIYQFVRDGVLTVGDKKSMWFDQDKLSKVLEQKSGNGGEKNALLIEMLRAAGLDAAPVLIGTRDHSAFNRDIYQLAQFNNLVCNVDVGGRAYLLDVAYRGVPFPFLPPDDLVSGGLLLKKSGSGPVDFPYTQRKSAFEETSKIRVHKDGSASCTTHVAMCGYQIFEKRDLLKAEPTKDEIRLLLLHGKSIPFEIDDYAYSREIDSDSAAVDLVLTFPALGSVSGSQLVCEPAPLAYSENPFADARRFLPVDFTYPVSLTDIVDLVCDEGLGLAATPPDVNASIDGIRFTRTTIATPLAMRLMSQLIIVKPVYPPSAYAGLRELFKKVNDVSADRVTITF